MLLKKVRKRKALSAVSEGLFAIGIIMVSVIFIISASNILRFQTERTVQATQENLAWELSTIINRIDTYNNPMIYTHRTDLSNYVLTVEENTHITVEIPEADRTRTRAVAANLKLEGGDSIENEENICIKKKESGPETDEITIQGGAC